VEINAVKAGLPHLMPRNPSPRGLIIQGMISKPSSNGFLREGASRVDRVND
jgi:hypothetical protein